MLGRCCVRAGWLLLSSILLLGRKALADGHRYIKRKQRPDGSFEGSWGVCFTYAAWFALEAYNCMGESYIARYTLNLLDLDLTFANILSLSSAVLYRRTWKPHASFWCQSRWKMAAGVRTLNLVRRDVTYRQTDLRYTTHAGHYSDSWPSGQFKLFPPAWYPLISRYVRLWRLPIQGIAFICSLP